MYDVIRDKAKQYLIRYAICIKKGSKRQSIPDTEYAMYMKCTVLRVPRSEREKVTILDAAYAYLLVITTNFPPPLRINRILQRMT